MQHSLVETVTIPSGVPPCMRYLLAWPSFFAFALRVELRVGLDGVCSVSGCVRFLFRASWSASGGRVNQYMASASNGKNRGSTFGGISALLVRMRWQVNSASMLKEGVVDAWLVRVEQHQGHERGRVRTAKRLWRSSRAAHSLLSFCLNLSRFWPKISSPTTHTRTPRP
jgi:hypothetical protein